MSEPTLLDELRSAAAAEDCHPYYGDLMLRAATALAARTSPEWQAISTAPKTWETILIAGRYANGVPYVEEGYRHADGHFHARKFEPPTHWMPLPAHPEQSQKGTSE